MLYYLLKFPVRWALQIFCRRVLVRHPEQLRLSGPLLVTANHPNSFLDAIIIGAHFHRPVHFLARGDAFHKRWHNRLLRMLKMIPVYRLSEGRDNLELNTQAFQACRRVLEGNGIVLIFIEGICVNSHRLQPFKKGAARIAIENRHLEKFSVLPLGIAYDSLNRFGKTVTIDAGTPISVAQLLPFDDEAKDRRYFNVQLFARINKLIHLPSVNAMPSPRKILLMLPAVIGYALHLPLYSSIKSVVKPRSRGTVFYDSILFGALLIFYPLYLLIAALVLLWVELPVWIVLTILLAHPLTAWSAVRVFSRAGHGH